jgi:uncharacterized protein YgiM (DUF1202 family)
MLSILSTAILLSACGSSSSDISEENTEIVATADTETESTETTDTETESVATADTETESIATADTETEKTEVDPDETITFDIEDLDKTMYVQKACNIRRGPSTEFDKVGSLSKNQKVHVIGTTIYNDKEWCLIESDDGTEQFVSASLLGTSKVSESSNKTGNTDKKDTSSSSSDSKKDTSSSNNSSSESKKDTSSSSESKKDTSSSDNSSSSSDKTYAPGETETITSASGDTFQIGSRGVHENEDGFVGTGHLD